MVTLKNTDYSLSKILRFYIVADKTIKNVKVTKNPNLHRKIWGLNVIEFEVRGLEL